MAFLVGQATNADAGRKGCKQGNHQVNNKGKCRKCEKIIITIINKNDRHRPGDNHDGKSVIPAAVTDADFRSHSAAKVALGKNLMFDKILSGNKNISCGTCHHAQADTGDGLSLPIGEGGSGLGVSRDTGSGADAVVERVPRNAPPVWNLGAHSFTVMFHDGRVSVDDSQPSGFNTPVGNNLPLYLENVLAAQAMFPVTSPTEMAGQLGENSVADAADVGNLSGPGGVWEQLAGRLQAIPEYVDMFIAAFDDIDDASDITYAHAANAIAAFEGTNWRADNSPFDRFLRGEKDAMSKTAKKGMKLFYGKAGCASCHSGKFQTDLEFHAVAMPQIGAGRGSDFDGHDDFGREQVTADPADRYKFRTPTLRNVALTAPYGHAGGYDTLRAAVEHHLDPAGSISSYDQSNAVLPSRPDLDELDFIVMDDPARVANIASYSELGTTDLDDDEVDDLIDFLNALTDPASIDIRSDLPRSVPSGLPLAD
ncbi:MAG: c-type cytochrome [Candidatus Brocadiaceae bacterium]|nr:c-type cytochrome [Candidatus Brocadiaceae bacterium]